jgi:hypothetical protein
MSDWAQRLEDGQLGPLREAALDLGVPMEFEPREHMAWGRKIETLDPTASAPVFGGLGSVPPYQRN